MKYANIELGGVSLEINVCTLDPTVMLVASQLFEGQMFDGQQMDLALYNLFVLTRNEKCVLVFPQVMTPETIEIYVKQVNKIREEHPVDKVKDGRLHMFVVHHANHCGLLCCQWREGEDHWEACFQDLYGHSLWQILYGRGQKIRKDH